MLKTILFKKVRVPLHLKGYGRVKKYPLPKKVRCTAWFVFTASDFLKKRSFNQAKQTFLNVTDAVKLNKRYKALATIWSNATASTIFQNPQELRGNTHPPLKKKGATWTLTAQAVLRNAATVKEGDGYVHFVSRRNLFKRRATVVVFHIN